MKKLIFTLTMSLTIILSYGQSDSIYVIKEVDDISGKTYIYANRGFVCAENDRQTGFKIEPYIHANNVSLAMITATMVNIGNCNENDEIIILFENGERIIKKSWKKFNCDGEAYFSVNKDDVELLRSQPLSKIRITNGRSYDSYTGDVDLKDKRYFIQLFYALDNKFFVNK